MSSGKPIYFLKSKARGWMGASLPKFRMTAEEVMAQSPLTKKKLDEMPWSQRHDYINSYALRRQELRWEEETGIKPEDSHFSLLIPIHNEENSLPSFLNALMLVDIPSSVDMSIIFITNACQDLSGTLVDGFLSNLGTIKNKLLTGKFKDQNVNKNCKIIKRGDITFIHVDTQTRGKANALAIGNSIALESGHTIAICIDATDFLEPDAIRAMFTHAHNAFYGKPKANDTVVLSGMGIIKRKASKLENLIWNDEVHRQQQHLIEDTNHYVLGCFVAWNTEWMHSIGGPPEVALEDYALGVVARANNFKIGQVKEANIWITEKSDLKSFLGTRTRYVRGMLQLLAFVHYNPSVVRIIEEDAYYISNLLSRVKYLLHKSKENPKNFPRYIATFLLWEYALIRGKREYKQNPRDQSWEKLHL